MELSANKKTLALVVDDNADMRSLVRAYLKRVGIEVVEANNGRQAVEMVESYRPDIVFSDTHMPEMCGLELMKWLRDHSPKTVTVLFYSTSFTNQLTLRELNELGVHHVMEKPFFREDVLEVLRKIEVSPEQNDFSDLLVSLNQTKEEK